MKRRDLICRAVTTCIGFGVGERTYNYIFISVSAILEKVISEWPCVLYFEVFRGGVSMLLASTLMFLFPFFYYEAVRVTVGREVALISGNCFMIVLLIFPHVRQACTWKVLNCTTLAFQEKPVSTETSLLCFMRWQLPVAWFTNGG